MKIIDLIGLLISNKTMPKHIIFEEEDYYWVSSANDYICSDHDATRLFNNQYNMSNLPLFLGETIEILEEEKKIPEKLDVIAYEKCIHEVTHKEKELALEIRDTQIAFNEIIDYLDYLKSKGDE